MRTYIFFYVSRDNQDFPLSETKKVFQNISAINENLYVSDDCNDSQKALIDSKKLLKDLSSIDPFQELIILLYGSEIPPDISLVKWLMQILSDYNCHLCLNHSCFSELCDPNVFDYRFLGIFACEKDEVPISLFDFVERDDEQHYLQKNDSKSVFEDSVFNFFGNRVSQAIAGFHNVLKIFPTDKASMKYIERGNKIITDERGPLKK